MSHIEAWKKITDNWSTPHWIPIPDEVKALLQLDSRLGMCNGMLVSKNGSQGMDDFIKRLNQKDGKK